MVKSSILYPRETEDTHGRNPIHFTRRESKANELHHLQALQEGWFRRRASFEVSFELSYIAPII